MSSASPVIIITGASKGIGKAATIAALEKFNARVVAIARSGDLLNELHEHVSKVLNKGDQLELVAGDATNKDIVQKAVDTAVQKWGRLDSVIANAGVLEPVATVAESSIEDWKKLFDVNFFSVILLAQIALPHLRKADNGSIVIVSSGAALKGYRGWGAYGSSKAAINHLTNTLGVEEPNVTTVALRPGVVDTGMQDTIRAVGAEAMKDDHAKFVDLHREGKLIDPKTPGHILSALACNPPKELSGRFFSWDDNEMKPYQPSV
ncbi:hypothetical protein BDF20DRAFT_869236 [Mycotypha africana]|uniref:uncharacterized protein n=1 Tax=Mycotypha africana TaxID=64632 RepID=UPI002300EC19|nr:uncharacterized protein BDF20DRAFT_869236 [Mycotypha africana]KAI8979386.1 hypothetical protein BDF20DRAFT_869236 [Mycotypha africana]